MSDDLILCVSFVSKSQTLDKFVLHIEHGLSNGLLEDYEYFREEHVFYDFMKLVPKHVADFVDFIVGVEEMYACVHVKE